MHTNQKGAKLTKNW